VLEARYGHVDPGGDTGAEVGVDRVQPAQHRGPDSRLAQRECLVQGGHAEGLRTMGQGGAGDVGRSVPEAVGLDHGHEVSGRPRGERRGVLRDGREVHLQQHSAPRHRPRRHREAVHAATAWWTGPYAACDAQVSRAQ
jgi:hypothetical protein